MFCEIESEVMEGTNKKIKRLYFFPSALGLNGSIEVDDLRLQGLEIENHGPCRGRVDVHLFLE